jgi:DNA ligase-4
LIEQKWLVRIILKDLKIGIGHDIILKNYHSEALDLFNSTSDLKEVFNQL